MLLIVDADATAHIGDLRYAKQSERIPQLKVALAAAVRCGDQKAQVSICGNLGLAYARLSDIRTAVEYYQQVLTIAREIRDFQSEGNAYGGPHVKHNPWASFPYGYLQLPCKNA